MIILRWLVLSALLAGLAACGTSPIKEPDSPVRKAAKSNVELGLGYLRRGDNKNALERLLRAVELDPGYAGAHHGLALAYQQFGQLDLAGKYFRRALRLDRHDSNLNNNYGAYLCQKGDYDGAEEYFVKAAEDPTYTTPGRAWENAGLCLVKGGKFKEAEKYLRSALKLVPDLPLALAAMAKVSFHNRNYMSARAYLQRYQAQRQLDAEMLWLAVRTERELGDGKAAHRNAMALRERFPNSQEAKLLLQR